MVNNQGDTTTNQSPAVVFTNERVVCKRAGPSKASGTGAIPKTKKKYGLCKLSQTLYIDQVRSKDTLGLVLCVNCGKKNDVLKEPKE